MGHPRVRPHVIPALGKTGELTKHDFVTSFLVAWEPSPTPPAHAALEKIRPPVGFMRTQTSIGYDLYYARNHPQPDGSRRVVLATNRWVSFREAANDTRSMQYQFTLIELHLDKNGKGEGKLVPAAKVSWDTKAKKIEIDNYNALPVDLINVTAKKP
jgi:hypothetical protein